MKASIYKRQWVQEWFDERQSMHMPRLISLADGTLVCTWTAGVMQWNGDPMERDASVWVSRLEPGADKWSNPDAVGNDIRFCCHNGSFVRNKKGELFLLFAKFTGSGRNYDNWCNGTDKLWSRKSCDGGITWEPARETNIPAMGLLSNDGVLLPNGEIVISFTATDLEPKYYYGAVHVMKSYDDGETWVDTALLTADNDIKVREPAITVLPDGAVQMFMRCCPPQIDWGVPDFQGTLYAYKSRSYDNGNTWSKPVPSSITNNESKLDICVWNDHTLLMAYNNTRNIDWHERSPLSLAYSHDWGETWNHLIEIAPPGGNKCQPAICKGKDGRLHVVYMHRHTAVEHVILDLED